MKQISAALAAFTAAATALLALATAPPAGAAGPAAAPPPRPAAGLRAAPPTGPCALEGITDNVAETARTPPGYARSSGTVRALTLLIDFPDARAPLTPARRYAEFFPAAADFFRTSSYGKLDYRSTPVLKWIRMSRPFASYGIKRGASFSPGSGNGYAALSQEILDAVDEETDFRDYDVINVLATPNAGPPATRTVLSVTFSGGEMGLFTDDGIPFQNVSFIWSRQTGNSAFRVLNHENGHSFGLPDLYYADGRKAPPPVGHWDPMDEDWGPHNDFMGWHKWKMGWLGRDQVNCVLPYGSDATDGVTEHTLTPTAVPGGTKIVVIPTDAYSAFVLEARERSALDPAVCRPGVLISWLATDIPSGLGPVHVLDSTPRSGGCRTTDPDVYPELTDAPFRPGETYTDPRSGTSVRVLAKQADGRYRVRVTAPRHMYS